MTKCSSNRIDWIDITKGIGIFLMVCGHTSIPKFLSDFIWSFHMPLFFIVSGMLYNPQKNNDFISFLKKKFCTLVIPYFFFLLCDAIYHLSWGLDFSWDVLTDGIQVGAYWFIQVLLVVEIINALLIENLFKDTSNKNKCGLGLYVVTILILSCLGYYAYLKDIHLPYRLEVVGFASIHFAFGFISKDLLMKIKIGILWILLFTALTLVCAQFLPRLDMNSNQVGWFVPNVLLSWLGTFSIMMISKRMEILNNRNCAKRFLLWAGQFSIVVMGLSQPVNMSLKYSLEMLNLPRVIAVAIQHSLLWILLIGISLLLYQYAPLLIGKNNKKS